MNTQPKLRLSALALAAAVTFGFASPDALALALGRVTVQSALGEPLKAVIDIPQITPEEVASLRATIASPEAYRAAGVEYSPALTNVHITLQKRPDGTYFLHLATDRPVSDPFVDVILDTNWSSGRVQREFTMLLDPPNTRQAATGTPLPAQASAAPAPQRGTAAAPSAPATAARPSAAPAAAPSTAARPAPAPAPSRAAAPAQPAPAGEGKRVTVQSGDTAGRLAAANKPASVSLDQMLVALLRANPDAFIDGNVNRLRSGAVLDMPSAEQAGSIAPEEARKALVVQSRDFNEFRRRLAASVPSAGTPAASRQASGKLQAEVEDKKVEAATPDRLTLSKGAVQGKASTADKIARERAAQDTASRMAELNKNIADLNRLNGSSPATGAGAGNGTGTGSRPGAGVTTPPGMPTAAPATAVAAGTTAAAAGKPASAAAAPAKPAPAVAGTAAPTAASAASAPASAPAAAPAATTTALASDSTAAHSATPALAAASAAPSAAAPASAAQPASAPAAKPAPVAAKAAPKRVAPPPPPEPSLIDDMLENPLIPALGVGLLGLLVGFAFYKRGQKRKTAAVDSSFLESRLQPDSFFGASGGQRIDTAEANNPTGSSMVYSPSQLDAAGDVDPVAEADVYLAYGRDLQAEEILKEALRINPQRVAIHSKLLEIYAKRRDAKAFEVVAAEAYNLTHGSGHDWEHICDLGRELDPSNPMYRPGGQPGAGAAAAAPTAAPTRTSPAPAPAVTAPAAAAASDIDLDLDFSLGDEPDTVAPAVAPVAVPPAPPKAAAPVAAAIEPVKTEPQPLEMDFSHAPSLDLPPVQAEPAAPSLADNSLDFEPVAPAPKAAPAPAPVASAPAAKNEMLEFDLGGLSLDLPSSSPAPAPAPVAASAPSLSLDSAPVGGDLQLGGGSDDADNPLATKLALAEEFNAIGDADGARSLAEEVLAEASGDLKSRAQKLLAEIG